MSIHGICFDEGNSGNCGPECAAHDSYECKIPDEILQNMIAEDKLEPRTSRPGLRSWRGKS